MLWLAYGFLVIWVGVLINTLLNRVFVPRLTNETARSGPLVSVIIPARDEERMIEQTVLRMLAQTYANLEIVVVNDRSTDATGEILSRLAQGNERLHVIAGSEPPPGWLGKPWAMHLGSEAATGSLLLFVDADVLYEPGAIDAAVAYFEDHDIGMLTLFPRLGMVGFWEHVLMPNLAVLGFLVLPLWLSNRSLFRGLAIGGGPGNLITRDVYTRLGGHETLRDAVVDDVSLARLCRKNGLRTHIVRASTLTSVRMYRGLREIVMGFTKNGFAAFGRSYLKVVLAIVITLVGNLGPYLLILYPPAAAAVVVIAIARLIVFVPQRYGVLNALLAHPLMIVVWIWIMIRSVWITGVRRQLVWRGRLYDARQTRFGAD